MKLFKKMMNRGKKGFTLAEMLIVLALLAILMSVAVPSIAGYVRRIKLMELDDSARAIFMAVQNKMTVMKQSGAKLEDFGSSFEDLSMPIPDIFEFVEPDPSDPEAPPVDKSNAMFALSRDLKDAGSLINLNATEGQLIEGQLYSHHYVIEYDALTGRVFGVFYSEEADDLEDLYKASTYKEDGSRDFEERLKGSKLVGYYGGDGKMTSVPVGGKVEKPELKVGNLEKLVVYVAMPDGCTSDKLYFSLSISDKNDPNKTVTIVPYNDGSVENYYILNGKVATIILDSLAPGCCSDEGKWYLKDRYVGGDRNLSDYVLERDFKGWVYNPARVDSFDPYVDGSDSWKNGKNYTDNKDDYVINPGSDIQINVTFYDDAGGKLETGLDVPVNSYFDKLDGAVAEISAGRHLQNLANYVYDGLVSGCKITRTIDFSLDTDGYDSWNSKCTYKGNAAHPDLYNFKPVAGKYVSESKFLSSFDGGADEGCEIRYLRIDTRGETGYDKTYTGFFTELYNSSGVKNIKFYCPVVKGGGEFTAVFFGKDTGGSNYSGLTVVNPIVEGPGNVGTMAGMKEGGGTFAGNSVIVEAVDDYFDNYSDNYAARGYKGGIDWSDPRNDPYSRFYVKGTTSESYAGGLVGYMTGVVQQSSAAIRVISDGYAGGLFGYSDSNIAKCHVGGHTFKGSFELPDGTYLVNIDGKLGAGGLVGYLAGGAPTGCYTTCSVRKYAGRNTYDTFIGISTADRSAGNGAYAIGSLIDVDNGIIIKQGSTWTGDYYADLETLIDYKDKAENSVTTCEGRPYDPSLVGKEYPYRVSSNTDLDYHTGDWPVYQSDFDGWGLFYWEKEGDECRIKAGYLDGDTGEFKNDISTLCTEKDRKSITEYGYGYFYSRNLTDVNASSLVGQGINKGTNDYIPIANALKAAGLQGVIFEVRRTSMNNNTHGDQVFSLKAKDGEGNVIDQTLIYNPDFCAMGGSSIAEYEIRSSMQLKYLSGDEALMDRKYVLTHDIDFSEGMAPIGKSDKPFTGTFDGKCYRIINARLSADNRTEAGVFGTVENAVIENVIVFNADYMNISLNGDGALGGIVGKAMGNSSIRNCAFTGKISVTSGNSLAAGGIVGVADGGVTIQNCEAVMHDPSGEYVDMSVSSAHGGIVAAGGIAGLVNGTDVLSCYSGGRITASGGLNYIGGIIGTNQGNSNDSISNCYTYYQHSDADSDKTVHPIGADSAVGDVSYTNCHYLGGGWYSETLEEDGTYDDGRIMCYEDADSFKVGTFTALGTAGGFNTANVGYLLSLDEPKSFSLPAVITDSTFYYHYGNSPIDEADGIDPVKPAVTDKLFGVFYWEKEVKNGGDSYKVKVGYYNTDGNYQGVVDKLCHEKDGNSITQSGYGYFVGKKSKKLEVSGFEGGTEITKWQINSAVKAACGFDDSTEIFVKSFDYTYSNDVTDHEVKVITENENFTDKGFKFIPGMTAVNKIGDGLTYEIRTQYHLTNVTNKMSAEEAFANVFTQGHDIVCNGSIAPIGSDTAPFSDAYDGGTYRIHKLLVERASENVGLFARTSGATIKNVIVVDGEIKRSYGGSANIGGLVGSAENGTTIQNCAYSGSIDASVGNRKIAGQNGSADQVFSGVGKIGGIAGNISASTITHCESTADISVLDIGITESGYIAVGGIAGGADNNAVVESSYSGGSAKTGKQMNNAYLSGIVGFAEGNASVSNCYTHTNIPGAQDNMNVHPIAQAKDGAEPTIQNCHYIEGMGHYANTLSIAEEDKAKVIKHTDFNINLNAADFGTAAHTYISGLAESGSYPLPAVVKNDKGEFVHYGRWTSEIKPLVPETYGIFYWENEGGKYSVKARYVADGKVTSAQSISLCRNMDGKEITEYGYGYLTGKAVAVDEVKLSGDNVDNDTKSALEAALRELGFSGIKIGAVKARSTEHKDIEVGFSFGGNELTLNGSPVKMKYNPDFYAIDNGSSTLKYEIRTAEQLRNISHYIDKGLSFTQTHDIVFSNSPNSGNEFKAIGTVGSPFKGTYDGGGYRIVKPEIVSNNGKFIGLFGVAKDAIIKNVIVFNGKITAKDFAASADDAHNGTAAVGGIVGLAENTTVQGCAFTGSISASAQENNEDYSYAVGGIVGCAKHDNLSKTVISSCEAVAKITWNKGNTPYCSVSMGGVAGCVDGGISLCYSGGELEAEEMGEKASVGGIVGSGTAETKECYSYAKITTDGTKNPIANGAAMTNCFYLKGENYYNEDVAADSGVEAKGTMLELQTALNGIIGNKKQYMTTAYEDYLTVKGVYAFAAVVKDKNGNFVHYGKLPEDDKTIEGLTPPAKVYKITVADGIKNGTITVTPEAATAGETITVTAVPNEEYKLEWINFGNAQNVKTEGNVYTFAMPEADVIISANFVKINDDGMRNITVKTVGKGTVDYPVQAQKGSTVKLVTKPADGWRVKSVEGVDSDGAKFDVWGGNNEYTFNMPDDDVTITVTFSDVPEGMHNVTINVEGNGKVIYDKQSMRWTNVTIKVVPDDGWVFDRIDGINYWGSNNEFTFNMPDGDVTFKVIFREQ